MLYFGTKLTTRNQSFINFESGSLRIKQVTSLMPINHVGINLPQYKISYNGLSKHFPSEAAKRMCTINRIDKHRYDNGKIEMRSFTG